MLSSRSAVPRAARCLVLGAIGFLACRPSDKHAKARSTDATRGDATGVLAAADTDDFGRVLPLDASFADRVVSLNPTATEVIFAIGAEAHLVGRSDWDEFPPAAKEIRAVGNGIRPNVEAVLGLKPTLVILYATAENRSAADALARAGVRTISLRVDHIAQFVTLTRRLGVVLGASDRAFTVIDTVTRTLARVGDATRGVSVRSIAWPLWQQPIMVVGKGSYLDELMEIAGGQNVFHDLAAPSPLVNLEEIARRDPDLIVTSAKSWATMQEQPQWRAVRAVRERNWLTDHAQLTGRPSVVLGMAANALAHALHPELAAQLPPLHRTTPP